MNSHCAALSNVLYCAKRKDPCLISGLSLSSSLSLFDFLKASLSTSNMAHIRQSFVCDI